MSLLTKNGMGILLVLVNLCHYGFGIKQRAVIAQMSNSAVGVWLKTFSLLCSPVSLSVCGQLPVPWLSCPILFHSPHTSTTGCRTLVEKGTSWSGVTEHMAAPWLSVSSLFGGGEESCEPLFFFMLVINSEIDSKY